jgi:hypothetical protein
MPMQIKLPPSEIIRPNPSHFTLHLGMSIAEAERLDPFGKGGKINPLLCILQ